MFILIACVAVWDVIIFEIDLTFSIQKNRKIQGKNVNILRMKRYFKMNQKTLFIIFKFL